MSSVQLFADLKAGGVCRQESSLSCRGAAFA